MPRGSDNDDKPRSDLSDLSYYQRQVPAVDEEASEDEPVDLRAVQDLVRGREGRFELGSWTRRGGMGEVSEVHDNLLGRTVVCKRPRSEDPTDDEWRAFVHEAQVTAQLNHPAIVPLLDLRKDDEGYLYLMPAVEGMTLANVLRGLPDPQRRDLFRWDLRRLLQVFRTICGAVAHAHGRGIVHRDIHPGQVLLGNHSEVLLTDWGLAARLGRFAPRIPSSAGSALSAASIRSGHTVLQGLHGQPSYQPPERLVEGRIPAQTTQDVYSLGAVLYHVLTLKPPVRRPRDRTLEQGKDPAYLTFLQRQIAKIVPPSQREARHRTRPLDPVWDEICLKAMAREPKARYPDAGELHEAVEEALSAHDEAERRRERAREAVEEGRHAVDALEERQTELREARRRRLTLESSIPLHRPLADKQILFDAEAEEEALARRLSTCVAEAERAFEIALIEDSTDADARAGLADLYLARLAEADRDGDAAARAYLTERLRRFDDGSRVAALSRSCEIRIDCRPRSARIRSSALVETERRLVPASWTEHGAPDDQPIELAPGRYALEIAADGRCTARYALALRPGETVRLDPRLPRREDLPEGFAYVPAGRASLEGDARADGCGPRRYRQMPDYAMAVFPVTMAEYMTFLDDIGQEAAREHVPRDPVDGRALWVREGDRWSIPERDAHGDPMSPDMPVLLIRARDADAYASWRAGREGRGYRLPTRDEWEYAARSGDGRIHPWGDREEATFAWGRDNQPGRPVPGAIGSCRQDMSPIGVRDLAGGVGDWLGEDFREDGGERQLGGGSWFAGIFWMRMARRFGIDPDYRSAGVGFRLLLEI